MTVKTMLLSDLLEQLAGHPAGTLVTFGSGDLSVLRVKDRGPVAGPPVLNIEFAELYRITLDPNSPD